MAEKPNSQRAVFRQTQKDYSTVLSTSEELLNILERYPNDTVKRGQIAIPILMLLSVINERLQELI